MLNKSMLTAISLLLLSFLTPDERCNSLTKKFPDEQNDGPYVLYKGNQIFLKYIVQKDGIKSVFIDSIPVSGKSNFSFWVNTDEPGKKFAVNLKKKIRNENAEYTKINKLLALSDIEGEFSVFRKLLQANGVIDTAYNWVFGNGHLVLTGDFVDRGEQVTEVLWLIYSLEEKAKAAGGYVHFILGNHEIMNLSNDLRYLNKKYIENTTLLNEKFETLFGKQSELGIWLRSKNIIEKIGDILFTHGGISASLNRMEASIDGINEMARPFYSDTAFNYPVPVDTLFGDAGPLWYRGYYSKTKNASYGQVDSTLQKFGITHISTGHTVVADSISLWYGGKIINTDVYHYRGVSEALLLENDKFYRVDTKGNKIWLLNRRKN